MPDRDVGVCPGQFPQDFTPPAKERPKVSKTMDCRAGPTLLDRSSHAHRGSHLVSTEGRSPNVITEENKKREGVHIMKSAIYARYSSAVQRETSITDQISLCREAAARFGCEVGEKAIFTDEEVSGSVAHRPGYQRLLKAAERREFGAIIVEAQDRLWRDQAEMHDALKRLCFWGVRVFPVAMGADLTDKTGRVLATVMGLKDEAFLEDLREKTRRGMAGQVRRNFSAGGRAYGYRSVPVYDKTRKDSYGQSLIVGYRRVIDEAEATVVRRIYEMYANGLSAKAIVYRLNAEHVPPPRPKAGRKAQGWTWTTISGSRKKGMGILNNELYRGVYFWNRSGKLRDPETERRVTRPRGQQDWLRVEVPELRIVPDELWNRVKARQCEAEKRRTKGHRGGATRHAYLFSGLLRCAECGAHYTARGRGDTSARSIRTGGRPSAGIAEWYGGKS